MSLVFREQSLTFPPWLRSVRLAQHAEIHRRNSGVRADIPQINIIVCVIGVVGNNLYSRWVPAASRNEDCWPRCAGLSRKNHQQKIKGLVSTATAAIDHLPSRCKLGLDQPSVERLFEARLGQALLDAP